ncbi:hypothetical protein ACHAPT_009152 [Fusarium lateritium]
MATTFHLFPRLPQEIQDLIWKEAAEIVRLKEREVHFFTIFNSRNRAESAVLAEYKLGGPSRSCLAAPRRRDGNGFSWTDNPSMYLMDRGLWTACRDSRAAIHEASGLTMCSESCPGCPACSYESWDETTDMEKLYDGPRIAKFVSDGYVQEMVVWPKNDLFCLQPYDWTTLGKLRLERTAIFPEHGKRYLQHVAFELPRGEVINRIPNVDRILHMDQIPNIDRLPDGTTDQVNDARQPSSHPMIQCIETLLARKRLRSIKYVWLIDYGLERPEPRPHAREFRANGLRFVEVTRGDREWTDSRGDGRDALDFVDWLKERWELYEFTADIGVLACESLDSDP